MEKKCLKKITLYLSDNVLAGKMKLDATTIMSWWLLLDISMTRFSGEVFPVGFMWMHGQDVEG